MAYNAEYHREYSRKNKDKLIAKRKTYRAANRDRLIATDRRYYETHRADRLSYQKEYRARNREALLLRRRALKYGIPVEELQTLLSNPACVICGDRTDNGGITGMHVDHSHANGKVRGILCAHCNRGIGCFADKPALLRRAARYLQGKVTQPPAVASRSSTPRLLLAPRTPL